ncbi:MAG: hypothetical protein ABSD27_04330 [Bryobacteraceae bacterium]
MNALYVLTGKGIWLLQHVEDALSTCITVKTGIKARGAMPEAQAEAVLAKHRSHTLGTSLRIAREGQVLSPSLQDRLEKFKEDRDWLVHRSLQEDGDDLYYIDERRHVILNRLAAFSEEAVILQRLIVAELKEFAVAQGVSRERIENYAAHRLSVLKGEDA